MQNSVTRKPIEIKIATVVAVAVHLNEADVVKLETALNAMTGGAPDFFDDEFAILDVEHIAHLPLDWSKIVALLKAFGLNAVAVRNALETEHAAIRGLGLSIELVSKARPELPAEASAAVVEVKPEVAAPAPAPAAQVAAPSHIPAMVIDTPVRAGQRIYARGCDLIITASVNNGAEVIADGSIHIYAPLRGRALAGARGNTDARIFVMSMEAELVSIAGIYRTFDNGFPQLSPNTPVQIKLIGDSIEVSSVKSL
jgi:septum site-determining protein MinC